MLHTTFNEDYHHNAEIPQGDDGDGMVQDMAIDDIDSVWRYNEMDYYRSHLKILV